jgi:hypothetical protein
VNAHLQSELEYLQCPSIDLVAKQERLSDGLEFLLQATHGSDVDALDDLRNSKLYLN